MDICSRNILNNKNKYPNTYVPSLYIKNKIEVIPAGLQNSYNYCMFNKIVVVIGVNGWQWALSLILQRKTYLVSLYIGLIPIVVDVIPVDIQPFACKADILVNS